MIFDPKYSVFNLIKEYKKYQNQIHAYLRGDIIEKYQDENSVDKGPLGMGITLFSIVFIILLSIFIWAVIVTIKNWKFLPPWAKVLAIIGLLTGIGGPVMTIIVVYISKNKK